MDLEAMGRKLSQGERGEALRRLAQSGDGAALSRVVDIPALEKAAKEGDSRALGEALRKLLSTPEGARFAAQVQKAAEHGR